MLTQTQLLPEANNPASKTLPTHSCCCCCCRSDTKFNSGCGWPAFYDNFEGAVDRHEDRAFGMVRTEITCSNCGAHLGHVFKASGAVCRDPALAPMLGCWLSFSQQWV